MIEIRIRNKLSDDAMEAAMGSMIKPENVGVLLRGEARVLKPDGSPLCVYLPGAITPELREQVWPTLHSLKGSYTNNRGVASGSRKIFAGGDTTRRNYGRNVDSMIAGAYRENTGPKAGLCRLTAWTGREAEKWQGLRPLFQKIADELKANVPDRYAAQVREAQRTAPDWVIPGTPFTTITINNTYSTAIHTDKGDLESGFSTLAVFRTGEFRGGWLCFPQYGVGVDMQDGDLLLMDAHDWHGNTPFDPEPLRHEGDKAAGKLAEDPGFERISVVSYFRTRLVECGSAADEAAKARVYAENRNAALLGD